MIHEFTAQEISDAARAARVYCPDFSEEQLLSLIEVESRLAESGFLGAVQSLLRLEEERGISCIEALDACKEAMQKCRQLEQLVSALETRRQELVNQVGEAKKQHEQITKSAAKAFQEREKIRSQCAQEEEKLKTYRKRMEKEKQRISREVEDCHQRANVTMEEILAAGKLKVEVESYGSTLETVLELSSEFAGHKNAREKLAQGLKQHGSLTTYLKELEEWRQKETARIKAEVESIQSRKKDLENDRSYLENTLSQLQSDIADEEALRWFYHRYQGVSQLMEEIAGWSHVFFMRCCNPIYALASGVDRELGNARFWTDKPPSKCPHCGCMYLVFDEAAYRAIGCAVGSSITLRLGD